MADVPSYLQAESVGSDSLNRLSALADLLLKAEADEREALEKIRAAKETVARIGGEEIPNLLHEVGLSELRLADGRKIEVKEEISVTITDDTAFFGFLAERQEEDLVKLNFAFPRMADEKQTALMQFLAANDYEYDTKKAVHPQTLKKYFRGLFGTGQDIPTDFDRSKVEPFAKVYTYNVTKIR